MNGRVERRRRAATCTFIGVVGMESHDDRRHPGEVRDATVLAAVGSDIALLCRQVESIRTDEGVPRDVRERLARIDHELARIARLTGGAGSTSGAPAPRLPSEAATAHELAAHLTGREWQSLELLVTGLNTRGMAGAMSVSVTTVRTHVQSLLAKLGVNSRLEAVALSVRTGLLDRPLRRGG
jgi:DNA-binding NarL/FixJ family response regulator